MDLHIHWLLIIVILSVVSTVQEDKQQLDECTQIMLEVSLCSKKFHLPTICDGYEKSEILECAEKATAQLPMCQEELARRMITHVVDIYRISDKILCSDKLKKEAVENKRCWHGTSLIANQMTFTARGLLSEKGCKFIKTVLYVIMVTHERFQCNTIMEAYIEGLYSRSQCADVPVETVTEKDIMDIKILFKSVGYCWKQNTELPACLDEKSNRVKCVENVTINEISNPQIRHIGINLVETTQKTDEVICADNTLHKAFLDSADCWNLVNVIGLFIVGQANGLYTEEGCQALKYQENYLMAKIDKRCFNLLREYRKAMDEVLPCVKRPPVSYSQSVPIMTLSQLAIILAILTFCINL